MKTVWITGASAGIGAALAEQMASANWDVLISARSKDKLESIAGQNTNISALPLDVTDLTETKEALAGKEIDCAVLNAGVYWPRRAENFDASDYHKHFEVNVQGVANGLEAVLPQMIERGQGQIRGNLRRVGLSHRLQEGRPLAASVDATNVA